MQGAVEEGRELAHLGTVILTPDTAAAMSGLWEASFTVLRICQATVTFRRFHVSFRLPSPL